MPRTTNCRWSRRGSRSLRSALARRAGSAVRDLEGVARGRRPPPYTSRGGPRSRTSHQRARDSGPASRSACGRHRAAAVGQRTWTRRWSRRGSPSVYLGPGGFTRSARRALLKPRTVRTSVRIDTVPAKASRSHNPVCGASPTMRRRITRQPRKPPIEKAATPLIWLR